MNLKELLDLLFQAAQGNDLKQDAAIGFNKYGFVFRDIYPSKSPYITSNLSSKVCGLGAFRELVERWEDKNYKIRKLDDLLLYDDKEDLLYAGSLKTLLPTLEFGGDEILFKTWVLIKTPDNKVFPAMFYYGPSGTSLGGWKSWRYDKVFPKDFRSIINYSPFDLSNEELEALIEALECALRKIPTTDFYGIYQHDDGYALMGIKRGRPFIVDLGYSYDDQVIKEMMTKL